MNVLSDYLTRPFGLIFSYQFCDQQFVHNRSADFLAPANVSSVSLLIDHAHSLANSGTIGGPVVSQFEFTLVQRPFVLASINCSSSCSIFSLYSALCRR